MQLPAFFVLRPLCGAPIATPDAAPRSFSSASSQIKNRKGGSA